MADIINLKQARKQRERDGRARRAAENRARHGRSKADRQVELFETARAARQMEQHRRDED